jgi:hypothetical protein
MRLEMTVLIVDGHPSFRANARLPSWLGGLPRPEPMVRESSRKARKVLDDLGGRRNRPAKEFDHVGIPGAEPLSTRGAVGCQFGQARGWPPRSIGYAWVCASKAKGPKAPPPSTQDLGRWTCPALRARS